MAGDTYREPIWRVCTWWEPLSLAEPPEQLGGFGSALQCGGTGGEWAQPLWLSCVRLD